MAWAERQYHECLLGARGRARRKYLHERGITPESIEQFHLGFSPVERDWILQTSRRQPERAKTWRPSASWPGRPPAAASTTVSAAGCCFRFATPRAGRWEWAAACCRDWPTSPAKYVNSPETPLFAKSQLLYGLDVAREAIRKSRTAMVMEGYTDCIVAHQYGFANAVAVLGTALGESHIRILKRFADRIVLVLDGDEAGQRRANEVLELFVAQQVDLRILTLPEELDPCEFLHERGGGVFPNCWPTRRSTPWSTPSARRPGGGPGARRPRRQPGPGAAGGDRGQGPAAAARHDRRGPPPRGEDFAAVGAPVPRGRGGSAAAG